MRVRTALVGCGKVGHIHAQALRTLPESDFIAACDASAERAQAFVHQYGVQPFTSVEALVREVAPQALCIATPHPLHAAPTIMAARAGASMSSSKSPSPRTWPIAMPCSPRRATGASGSASSVSGASSNRCSE